MIARTKLQAKWLMDTKKIAYTSKLWQSQRTWNVDWDHFHENITIKVHWSPLFLENYRVRYIYWTTKRLLLLRLSVFLKSQEFFGAPSGHVVLQWNLCADKITSSYAWHGLLLTPTVRSRLSGWHTPTFHPIHSSFVFVKGIENASVIETVQPPHWRRE